MTGWVRRRIAALPQGAGNRNDAGSAAVPGRINPMTDRAPASITQIRRPIFHRLGAAKNRRAPTGRWKPQRQRERGRPRPHQPVAPNLTPVSIIPIRRPDIDRLGVHKQRAWNQIGVTYKTTCLSPYRYDASNNVPVPISAAPADQRNIRIDNLLLADPFLTRNSTLL